MAEFDMNRFASKGVAGTGLGLGAAGLAVGGQACRPAPLLQFRDLLRRRCR